MAANLLAGAASIDISPRDSQFLYGYPHEPRYSTGIHDPLLSASLYLCDGGNEAVIIANDLIYVSKEICARIRARITAKTGIPGSHIMISATHTHSGPVTVDVISCSTDPVVPPADVEYLKFFEDQVVECAVKAQASARPAEIGLTVAAAPHSQTNRHNPTGPSDPAIPVLVAREVQSGGFIACMAAYSLHPTALHEDSTLISADFPGMARQYLHDTVLGEDCPILYHTGPAGNQSPRYLIRSNDFVAARKLGREVGHAIRAAIPSIQYVNDISITFSQAYIDLIRRDLPTVAEASERVQQAKEKLERLRQNGSRPEDVRTAECDWFGTEETLTLAQAAQDGRVESVYKSTLPCEVQAMKLGPWIFVAWPGEVFVEYALQVKKAHEDVFVISMANGEFQGYIVTEDAVRRNSYEACSSIFDPRSGQCMVEATIQLVNHLRGSQSSETTSWSWSPATNTLAPS